MSIDDTSPLEYFKHCVTAGYADFDGRARRSEYWYFTLFSSLITIPLATVLIIGIVAEITALMIIGGILFVVYGLTMFLPSIAVTVRRLHDTNKSGWYYLMKFLPFGDIIMLVFTVMEGDHFPNLYGPDPKAYNAPELTDHLQQS